MNIELSIGGLAKAAGVNVETVRYYQRRGLMEEPYKSVGRHRRYAPSAVLRLRFIRCAQQLGFTLEEIAKLLAPEGTDQCAKARRLAEQKLALIDERIDELARMRARLTSLVAACAGGNVTESCPIIDKLSACSVASSSCVFEE